MIDWITDEIAIGTRADAEDPATFKAGVFRSVLSYAGSCKSYGPMKKACHNKTK